VPRTRRRRRARRSTPRTAQSATAATARATARPPIGFAVAPRDFVKAEYRFRSTASGRLPTDDDLRRSIVGGLGGTGMVPQNHLSGAEVDAVIEYVKSFSPRFANEDPPRPMKLPAPSPRTDAGLARGAAIYRTAGCHNCHGDRGEGDGTSASDLSQAPANLSRHPLKGGSTAADIVRAVVTGLNGTAMPSYHLLYDDPDMWDLAYYVESLGRDGGMTEQERIGWEVEGREPGTGN
jgi:cytochrome c553